jgi:hypothetical protein
LAFLGGSGQKPKDSQLQQQQASPNCVRFQYDASNSSNSSGAVDAGSHMFRSTGFRFFNNVVIPLASEEDRVESLKAGLAVKPTQKKPPKKPLKMFFFF